MKILVMSDEESDILSKYYKENNIESADIFLSAGDLPYQYLRKVGADVKAPVFYVKGNHDKYGFEASKKDCIEWKCIEYRGTKIAGIGCMSFSNKLYSEKKMEKALGRLYKKICSFGGVDIVVSHYPAMSLGDGDDVSHRGYRAIKNFIDKVKPKYFVYGHNHLNYGRNERVKVYGDTALVNAYKYHIIEFL